MEKKKLSEESVDKVSGGAKGKDEKKYNFTTHSGMQVNVTEKKNEATGRIIRTRIKGK